MHKLELALAAMAKNVGDAELSSALTTLASISHNYSPPEKLELDVPDDFFERNVLK